MTPLARVVDAVLETTVVGSFSRVGYEVRSRLGRWPAHDRRLRLDGRTVVVTGATSGIGLAAASRCAQLGADVRFVARSRERAERARDRIELAAGRGAEVAYELADVSDLSAVRELAAGLSASVPRIDVLVHNAGALTRTPSTTADGSQLTLAAHVLGPFLLTGLLLDRLRGAAPARVITVSSGGMYTERLDVADLEMDPAGYDGRVAYARAKRAQVALTHEWASRVPSREVRFHSMHPGWVDTPGLAAGMPAFRRVMRPLLRTPEQGADTVVWLASVEDELPNGSFWHDRRPRSEHRVPSTRVPDQGAALWAFCQERTGWAGP